MTIELGWWHIGLALFASAGVFLGVMWFVSRLVPDMGGNDYRVPSGYLMCWLAATIAYVAVWGWLS